MLKYSILSAVTVVALAALASSEAQAGDYCRRYADSAVRMANDAARCGLFRGFHTNWHHHYSWCERNPASRSGRAIARMQGEVTLCQASLRRPAAPPPPAYMPPPPPPPPPAAYVPPQGYVPPRTQYAPPPPVHPDAGWQTCAQDNTPCVLQGRAIVRYGANGIFVTQQASGSIMCSPATFGVDPVPNVPKTCQFRQ